MPWIQAMAGEAILPEGTRISLQLNNNLSTTMSTEGDKFTAVVISPVYSGDRIVIPKGSEVSGTITRIIRPGRFKGKAVMNLLFRSIDIPGRGELPIVASLVRIDPEADAIVHLEGGIEREGSPAKDLGRVVTPALAGAGVGALAGGRRGAAIGAGIGSAIGLASIFATRGNDLQVRKGSTLIIALDRPLVIK